ncbi:MAG: polyprenyl synthetase family protein [Candidatus Neptunochlamydia sp.]|nr:polyprenyl synthetase family protein [Candidatus Neptunochlamydia sp.]
MEMEQVHLKSTLNLLIDKHLSQLIPEENRPQSLLYEAARYSLLLPGKRLRPIFLLKVLEDYGIPVEKGLDAAAAIEMIHTYSLIHDDLPCMDDDDLRRGKPSLHKVYGEGQAVLAGDFLLTYAFEVLAKSSLPREIITIIAKAAGGEGMIGGQIVDLLSEETTPDWDTLLFMYLGKTAALFSSALECGAVISGASYSEQTAFRNAGKYFGIAFQIHDDILDVTSDEETLGKPVFSDVKNKKSTCLLIFGLEKAKDISSSFLEKALNALPEKALKVQELLQFEK